MLKCFENLINSIKDVDEYIVSQKIVEDNKDSKEIEIDWLKFYNAMGKSITIKPEIESVDAICHEIKVATFNEVSAYKVTIGLDELTNNLEKVLNKKVIVEILR